MRRGSFRFGVGNSRECEKEVWWVLAGVGGMLECIPPYGMRAARLGRVLMDKGFLLLFFKKEGLCYTPLDHKTVGAAAASSCGPSQQAGGAGPPGPQPHPARPLASFGRSL